MKVLYVASEVVPFAKTGGLADVAGSLPQALKEENVDIRVIMPKFGKIDPKYTNAMEHVYDGELDVAWRKKYVGLDKYEKDGITYYFVDNQEYFGREGFYGYDDDAERFSFFCRAVLNLLPVMDFWPDVIHTNDWHAGLVNVLLKLEHMDDERYRDIRTLYTIHNLKYQGVFPKEVMSDVLGLDWKYFNNGDLEFYDAVNFMKGGIIYADYISTVSKTYAQEIQYEYFGENLDGLLRSRQDTLFGIVNGLDYNVYNPATDNNLFETYDIDSRDRKADNKTELQNLLGLPNNRRTPMVALVSRLVAAKGLDLIVRMMDEILQHEDIQFVMLGTGDREYEEWFKGLEWRFPNKVSANIKFSNELAQRIYAAADIFLMPSDYEPCGIGQLIALRYGAIPVVRETGGLKDTVQQYDKYTNEGNGFVFGDYNAHEMMYALKRALSAYENFEEWQHIVANAMNTDYSWKNSAKEYKELYQQLLEE
ncbi:MULTISPECIES: glycogen synthase GlgA [Selenomonas]|uniref:Glycogen synthase n=1 Tax=Selenomonas ruminis TaxID=2593411 RepID=A0A5D6W6A1_9FIRM|nr:MULTISPECIES: glycogen synthase GlgA [unclassified Selenomonas]MBQ1867469.1 glycogen synthase GlgA [Selenomonas sp.]TYZ23396.1 glycogen synthase GlgA [Selenomonas sp. mPRGC5]